MEPAVSQDPTGDPERGARSEHLRANAAGVFVWALLGLFMGGLGPGVAALMIDNGWEFAGFVVSSEAYGLLSGALIGLIDPPRRLPGNTWQRPLWSGLVGIPLGVAWAASAGAVGGAGFAAIMTVFAGAPPNVGDTFALFSFFGMILGAIVGTPGVVLFSAVRGWTLSAEMPWWIAHAAAIVVTAFLSFPGFALIFGGMP